MVGNEGLGVREEGWGMLEILGMLRNVRNVRNVGNGGIARR